MSIHFILFSTFNFSHQHFVSLFFLFSFCEFSPLFFSYSFFLYFSFGKPHKTLSNFWWNSLGKSKSKDTNNACLSNFRKCVQWNGFSLHIRVHISQGKSIHGMGELWGGEKGKVTLSIIVMHLGINLTYLVDLIFSSFEGKLEKVSQEIKNWKIIIELWGPKCKI